MLQAPVQLKPRTTDSLKKLMADSLKRLEGLPVMPSPRSNKPLPMPNESDQFVPPPIATPPKTAQRLPDVVKYLGV